MKTRKKKQPNGNRREDLLRVCARLFREKGFDGTTIRDISGAAGMHSGSPFYHFRTKQDMLVAVIEQGLALPAPANPPPVTMITRPANSSGRKTER